MSEANQRGHFRLAYPQPDRPTFIAAGGRYPVIDLSERGMRFQTVAGFQPGVGEVIKGKVQFVDGTTCTVTGKVLRYAADLQCVLVLTEGVPLARMMEEHRRILKKYQN